MTIFTLFFSVVSSLIDFLLSLPFLSSSISIAKYLVAVAIVGIVLQFFFRKLQSDGNGAILNFKRQQNKKKES